MEPKRTNAVDRVIGARVRARRASLGMSQERLGAALGITFQQVQKYERGTNRISASRLHAIATVLGTEVSYFFGDQVTPTDHPIGFLPKAAAHEDELVALACAFTSISDPDVRRVILNLVRSCAGKPVSELRTPCLADFLLPPGGC
jgi:transcriptional regulator with XRE-family HTH domain